MKTTLFTRLAISSFLVTIKAGGKSAVDAHRIGEPLICSNLTDKDACNGAAPCVWKHGNGRGGEAKCVAPDPPTPTIPVFPCGERANWKECGRDTSCEWIPNAVPFGCRITKNGRRHPEKDCKDFKTNESCQGEKGCELIPRSIESGTCENKEMQVVSPQKE